MKRTFYTIVLSSLTLINLASCTKNDVNPTANQGQNGNTIAITPPLTSGGVAADTAVNGYLKLRWPKTILILMV